MTIRAIIIVLALLAGCDNSDHCELRRQAIYRTEMCIKESQCTVSRTEYNWYMDDLNYVASHCHRMEAENE